MTPEILTLSNSVWPSISALPVTVKTPTVETPITFKVFVLTLAVPTPDIPVSPLPSPLNEVAETVPVTVTPDAEVSSLSVLLCFRIALPPLVKTA